MCDEKKNNSRKKGGDEPAEEQETCFGKCTLVIPNISDVTVVEYVRGEQKTPITFGSAMDNAIKAKYEKEKQILAGRLSIPKTNCQGHHCECIPFEGEGRKTIKKTRTRLFKLLTKGIDEDDGWVRIEYKISWEIFEGFCVDEEEPI